jgi:hypothetical protein
LIGSTVHLPSDFVVVLGALALDHVDDDTTLMLVAARLAPDKMFEYGPAAQRCVSDQRVQIELQEPLAGSLVFQLVAANEQSSGSLAMVQLLIVTHQFLVTRELCGIGLSYAFAFHVIPLKAAVRARLLRGEPAAHGSGGWPSMGAHELWAETLIQAMFIALESRLSATSRVAASAPLNIAGFSTYGFGSGPYGVFQLLRDSGPCAAFIPN